MYLVSKLPPRALNFYNTQVLPNKYKSSNVIEAIASTMGTARGNTHGSWRPRALMMAGLP